MALVLVFQSSLSSSFSSEMAPEPYLVAQLAFGDRCWGWNNGATYCLKRCVRLPLRDLGVRCSVPGRDFQSGMFSSVGVPHKSKIRSS
jgi:hypothetical protein